MRTNSQLPYINTQSESGNHGSGNYAQGKHIWKNVLAEKVEKLWPIKKCRQILGVSALRSFLRKEKNQYGAATSRTVGEAQVEKTVREQILQRFEKWLDEVLAEERPLEGIDHELLSELEDRNGSATAGSNDKMRDLYSTWSATTALTQEVKLQGRAFSHLSDKLEALSGLSQSVDSLLEAHRDTVADARHIAENVRRIYAERETEVKLEARDRAQRGVISVLLDIRDRLIIGLRSAGESQMNLNEYLKSGWLNRLLLNKSAGMNHMFEIVSSLKRGYRLSLDRLDEALQQFGVSEIICEGEPFDPQVMTAVDIEETVDMPDGTVLEVYRTGYLSDTEVLRPAQVKVARAPEKNI